VDGSPWTRRAPGTSRRRSFRSMGYNYGDVARAARHSPRAFALALAAHHSELETRPWPSRTLPKIAPGSPRR
jgi:hypothetical protein